MEEKSEWITFDQIEWHDPKFNRFNIDTRDFHAGYHYKDEKFPDFSTLAKYPRYFYTSDEVMEHLSRLYTESGGKGEWRMLTLVSNDERVLNWNLKYLRIWRTDLGFLICNQENKAIGKDLIVLPVEQEYLSHH